VRRRCCSLPVGCDPRPCSRLSGSPTRIGGTRQRRYRTCHLRESSTRRPGGGRARTRSPRVSRWNGKSLSSGQLARTYGFTDLDGSQPDPWRYLPEVHDAGKPDTQPDIADTSRGTPTCLVSVLRDRRAALRV